MRGCRVDAGWTFTLNQAGDILLEKTPFRLTDKLIPGYWGHAAVWIGGEVTPCIEGEITL